MKSQPLRHLAALLGLALASAASALAQASAVPNLISYQGRIADAAGVLVGSTAPVNRLVLFRIYDSPSASAAANRLYSEQQTVTIANGEFSVLVGSGTAISTESTNAFSTLGGAVFGGATRYLGVTVDDGDGNPFNDPESSPRQQIVSAPFAFRSQVAESVALGGVNSLSLANNSVTTAAIAAGAITGDKLAANAIGTTQLAAGSVGSAQLADGAIGPGQIADGLITNAKLAATSVDSSKIVDGSIQLGDLSSSVRTAMPKPRAIYNQGLGANTSVSYTIFPIDLSDYLADSESCLISYHGLTRTGVRSGTTPTSFFGTVRVMVARGILTAGSVSNSASNTTSTSVPSTAATAGESTTPQIYVQHTGSTATTTVIQNMGIGHTTTPPGTYTGFPTDFSGDYLWYAGTQRGGINSSLPGIWPLATVELTLSNGGTNPTSPFGVFHIFGPYPGVLLASPTYNSAPPAAPYNQNQANLSTNANAGGPPRTQSITSVVTDTNKLTITLNNPHAIQVGDTVTLAAVTGAPSAVGTFTVTAQPDRTSFEIALTGATGTYTGGTVTYTPKFSKYRLWVAVRNEVAVRVVVSAY